ncbi:MAG: class I SAM-dependent methyltransferase [Cyanobacteria bacterium P01_A01_bin.84]
MKERYDAIGSSYSKYRQPDSRIVNTIVELLSLSKTNLIADIGAGTGNYSRALANLGYFVHAVEPSSVMMKQSISNPNIQWFDGYAESIPLPNASVDGVICILAAHHFSDLKKSVREMHRITKKGRLIFLTFDPRMTEKFWFSDYFPSIWQQTFEVFPPINDVAKVIADNTSRSVKISKFILPPNLTDMFAAAGWRQPEIYLNPEIRSSISAFALADTNLVENRLVLLKQDLDDGKWNAQYGEILKRTGFDAGYRFLSASLRD